MKTAIVSINQASASIAKIIKQELDAKTVVRTKVGSVWNEYDAFIFIGALGICVRTIAPYIKDKHTDPAVGCIDSNGTNVTSALSGHVRGANELTMQVARILGATPVITTQSDNSGLWALDTFERRFHWAIASDLWDDDMNRIIFTFVNR